MAAQPLAALTILPSSMSSSTQCGLTPTQIVQPPASLTEDASPAIIDVLTVPDVGSEYDVHILHREICDVILDRDKQREGAFESMGYTPA